MEPTTITDKPIPLITGGFTPSMGISTDNVVKDSGALVPATNVSQSFPTAHIAQETISTSINSETKKILAAYGFEQLGAIEIGEFQQGVSGDIRVSPDGIIGRNINGDETFVLDGTTGDALFKGTVEAAGFVLADQTGLVSLNNFPSSELTGSTQVTTSSTSYQVIPGSTLTTFSLPRDTRLLLTISVLGQNQQYPANGTGSMLFRMFDTISNVAVANLEILGNAVNTGTGIFGNDDLQTLTFITTFGAGSHTLRLEFKSGDGNTCQIDFWLINYVLLGS